MKRIGSLLILLFTVVFSFGQSSEIKIQGRIVNGLDDLPVEFASVFIEEFGISTDSDDNGYFILETEWKEGLILGISRLGFRDFEYTLAENKDIYLEITLVPQQSDVEVIVTESRLKATEMIRERAEELRFLPSASGNFEAILPYSNPFLVYLFFLAYSMDFILSLFAVASMFDNSNSIIYI